MNVSVIVQARMTSTRLPGKVLEQVSGKSILHHVLDRCALIPGVDVVCCAVPEGAPHDVVAEEARTAGVAVVRGSEVDVLDRYHSAARILGSDIVMRVTSDCPLIDPGVCGEVLSAIRDDNAEYAANNFTHCYPHGLDCEAFTRFALDRAWRGARDPYEREHVTPWLRRAPDVRRVAVSWPDANLGKLRWTLDYPEDLAFFRAFMPLLKGKALPWLEAVELLQDHPEIAALNAVRADR